MKQTISNKAPSREDVARMLRRKNIVSDEKFPSFDFQKIDSPEAIQGIAGYLAKKVPSYYSVVIGAISDNSHLSQSVAEHLCARHFFASEGDGLRVTLNRFNGPKKVNVLLVKALVDDVDINEWHGLPLINENVQRLAVATVVDGRFLPCANNLEIYSLTDYDHLQPESKM